MPPPPKVLEKGTSLLWYPSTFIVHNRRESSSVSAAWPQQRGAGRSLRDLGVIYTHSFFRRLPCCHSEAADLGQGLGNCLRGLRVTVTLARALGPLGEESGLQPICSLHGRFLNREKRPVIRPCTRALAHSPEGDPVHTSMGPTVYRCGISLH